MLNTTYFINEIFATVQGEATFAGTPSIFIRLQGCNVGCPWCDTKHTWSIENINGVANPIIDNQNKQQLEFNKQFDFRYILNKTGDDSNWEKITLINLIKYIETNSELTHINHVVITGGEPAMYDLMPLCNALHQLGKTTQIETSGTENIKAPNSTWVTLSPKFNMPGGKHVLKCSIERANEIKMPIGKITDIENLKQFIASNHITKPSIWLQPLSQNTTATKLCIHHAMLNNWKLSIQVHKYLNIR